MGGVPASALNPVKKVRNIVVFLCRGVDIFLWRSIIHSKSICIIG